MNACDDVCVVCGEPSAALICRECNALIGAKPLRPKATEAATIAGGAAEDRGEELSWTAGGTSSTGRSSRC